MGKWLTGNTEEECTSQVLVRPRCSEVSDPVREVGEDLGPTEVGMETGWEEELSQKQLGSRQGGPVLKPLKESGGDSPTPATAACRRAESWN